ncbi:GntR family transcriptional regulator [Pseudomonas sp. dw_358]|uniref:GntR family transcriptional regulator n=1 Tax=Pseudomonas sp. dw_358 TaxID=2720083 RepID=UPI001BD39D13|nr:GntR family transcriptional regulator [Pseudomonas sp. dw_358]
MTRQVRFDKKTQVINELVRRIKTGQMNTGELLPGENILAQEFNVSRGTLREALLELKRRNFIATQTGVGSIVTYDGISLDQRAGWAQALADTGASVHTQILRLAPVERADLAPRLGTADFIALDRRRVAADGRVVSLERALIPTVDGLERLPQDGLIDDSLTVTLAAHGFVGDKGDQWIGAEPLSAEDAELMSHPVGSVFLKAVRTTFDRRERFMEHVESLLDPVHFRLHLAFGSST